MGDTAREHRDANKVVSFAATQVAKICPGQVAIAVILSDGKLIAHAHKKSHCTNDAITRLTKSMARGLTQIISTGYEEISATYSGDSSLAAQGQSSDNLLSTFAFVRHNNVPVGAVGVLCDKLDDMDEAYQLLTFAVSRLSESFGHTNDANTNNEPRESFAPARSCAIVAGDRGQHHIKQICKHLGAIGFEIVPASTPEAIYEKATATSPRLIVLDQGYLAEKIFAMLELIRSDPRTRHCAIVVVSDPKGPRVSADETWNPDISAPYIAASVRGLHGDCQQKRGARVLLALSDPKKQIDVGTNLSDRGYLVREVEEDRILKAARSFRPEVVITDKTRTARGSDVVALLRSNPSTALTSIFQPARLDDVALHQNLQHILCQRDKELGSSPNTGLPGSNAIAQSVNKKLLFEQGKWAFCYLDLDHFKSFNDTKGCAKADSVIRHSAELIANTLTGAAPGSFLGHIAGDDFFFVVPESTVDTLCSRLCAAFDSVLPNFYTEEERALGYIEAVDRYGKNRKFPMLSISVVAITALDEQAASYTKLTEIAAKHKRIAKRSLSSSYVRDGKVIVGDKQPGRRKRKSTLTQWLKQNVMGGRADEDTDSL